MNSAKREHWNEKFQQGRPSLGVPDPFFLSAFERYIQPAFPRAETALDIAGGLGRHALLLAKGRWDVTVVDISKVALDELDCAAKEAQRSIRLIRADAAKALSHEESFNLVLLFYHFEWELLPKIVAALSRAACLSVNSGSSGMVSLKNEHGEDVPSLHDVPALLSELEVLHQQTRKLVHRGVLEWVAKKQLSFVPEF